MHKMLIRSPVRRDVLDTVVIHRYRRKLLSGSQDHHSPLNKIESYPKYSSLRQYLFFSHWAGPVVQRIIDPSKHSDGMFRWVCDLTNNSQFSWLNVLNNGKSVPYRNTGVFFSIHEWKIQRPPGHPSIN